jgi:hypothetical protein
MPSVSRLRSEAHFAYFLLNLSFQAFSFSFGFKAGIVSHFPDLGFHRALDLFGFAFDLIFVPHTCLLEMIASLEVELWASGELEDSREDEKRVSWTRFSTILMLLDDPLMVSLRGSNSS